jgi:hypothetical protein
VCRQRLPEPLPLAVEHRRLWSGLPPCSDSRSAPSMRRAQRQCELGGFAARGRTAEKPLGLLAGCGGAATVQ